MRLTVRVHPAASREAVEPRPDGSLEIWVRQPAVDGRANQAIVDVLVRRLGVPRRDVTLVRGATSRTKVVEVPLESWEAVVERLRA